MKKTITFFTMLVLLCVFSAEAFAATDFDVSFKEEYEEISPEEEYNEELISALSEETLRLLGELGITEVSLGEIFAVTPKKVFSVFFDVLSGSLKEPFSFCLLSAAILFVVSLGGDSLKGGKLLEAAGVGLSSLVLAVPLANIITTVFSLNEVLCEFGAVFSGVFAATVSSAGGSLSAVSYEGAVIFFNSVISVLSQSFSKPLINGMCAFAFFSSIGSFSFTSRMSELLKKIYIGTLSFFGTVFTSFLSLKSVLSHSADTIASKSMKFIIGKSVPVVGGAVSESYSFVTAGLSLVKNTVGVFGIVSIAITVLPTLFSLACWKMSLFLCESFAEMFSPGTSKAVFSVFRDVITLLISTLIFISSVFIVSAGALLVVTGGGKG